MQTGTKARAAGLHLIVATKTIGRRYNQALKQIVHQELLCSVIPGGFKDYNRYGGAESH